MTKLISNGVNNQNTSIFYLWAAKIFIFLSVFSPLIVHGDFYFPYIAPKTIFFQLMATMAIFFYVLLAISDKSYLPKLDLMTKAVLGFFGVYALAGILGVNPERSFFGTYERMLGVVNVAHFVGLFFVAKAVFKSANDWLWLLRVFIFAGVLVSLYGLGQWLGWGTLYHAGAGRIDATIGNAAFVAGYLIFSAFFTIFALILEPNLNWKYFYAFALVLNLWGVYASATRGGFLGLIAAAIIIFAAYLFKKEKKLKFKKEFLLFGGVFAVMVFALAFFSAGKSAFFSPIDRMLSISLTDTTTNTRVLAAKSSWEGFLERPILGWGPQNYNLVFDKSYNPKIYPMENWFDHAHSIIFDTLVATGAIGFIIYFLFLGVAAFYCWRFVRSNSKNYWLGIFPIALLAAYLTQNIFVFDSLVTYLPFFLFLAFVSVLFVTDNSAVSAEKKDIKKQAVGNTPLPAILILLAIFSAVGYWFSIRPALGAYFAVEALKTNPNEIDTVTGYFKRSLSYGNASKNAEIRGRIADYSTQLLSDEKISLDKRKSVLGFAVQEVTKSAEENHLDFRNYLYLASFLQQSSSFLSNDGGNTLLQEADKVLEDAYKLAPRKQLLFLEWSRIKFKLGDYQGAVDKLKIAVDLNPDVEDPRWRWASAYSRAGETEKGEAEAKEARRVLSEKNPQAKINARMELDVAFALKEKGFEDKASDIFKNILANKEYISDEFVLIKIAEEFARKGDEAGAISAANRVAEVNPALREESDKFIKAVEQK